MSRIDEVIFPDHLPKLDLHGFDRDTATYMVKSFIIDHVKMKTPVILIVPGVGTGILKKTVMEVLKAHKMVIEYKTVWYNPGAIMVQLNV